MSDKKFSYVSGFVKKIDDLNGKGKKALAHFFIVQHDFSQNDINILQIMDVKTNNQAQ